MKNKLIVLLCTIGVPVVALFMLWLGGINLPTERSPDAAILFMGAVAFVVMGFNLGRSLTKE